MPTPAKFEAKLQQAQVRGVLRVLSLLLWKKGDMTCHVMAYGSNCAALKVAVCDAGLGAGGTALLREDLFTHLVAPASLRVAVNLSHLVNALALFTSGSMLAPVALLFPSDDGKFVIECRETSRATRVRIATQVCEQPADFRFTSAPVAVEATVKAELIREIAETLEEMAAPSREGEVTISYSVVSNAVSFSTTGSAGSVNLSCTAADTSPWILGVKVHSGGTTRVRLEHLLNTVKTEYFREMIRVGAPGVIGTPSAHDKVTLRVNTSGQLCLLFHIKLFDRGSTSGVECVINPLVSGDDCFDVPDR